MKLNPQIIYKKNTPEYVILSFKQYSAVLEMIEEQILTEHIKQQEVEGGEIFPSELVFAISRGKNRIKAYREYRKLSVQELAEAVTVTTQQIESLEAGTCVASHKILKALAKALQVDASDLT